MTRTRAARLLGLMLSLLALSPLAPGGVAAAQSQGQEIMICHRTGSPTNPWVFMTIEASTWPEHEAQGDVRANSLADCPRAAAAAQVAPAVPPPAQPAQVSQPALPAQPAAQPAAGGSQAAPGAAQPASPAQPGQVAIPAQPPQVADVEVAGAESAPPVSSLPASGGEPDRPALVAGLLTLLLAGLGLRRLGRRAHS